jgi:hypothetical protein
MVLRLSVLCAGHCLPLEKFLRLITIRGWVNSEAILQLEGLRQFEKSCDCRNTHFAYNTVELQWFCFNAVEMEILVSSKFKF